MRRPTRLSWNIEGSGSPLLLLHGLGATRDEFAGLRPSLEVNMPSFRPYSLKPGQRLEVEVIQPDGGRALVAGVLDAVPETTHGQALRIRVCDARVQALGAE